MPEATLRTPTPSGPLFIVFEGGEGSGKSTQARALYRRLCRQGVASLLTRDPGGTELGKKAERWLKRSQDVPPQTELLLFTAARSLLTADVIRPALEAGTTVISDRYAPSSVAYQGYGRGINLSTVAEANRLATGGLHPDLVILLDVPPEKGLGRKSRGAWDRFHEENLAFHRKVRQGYLEMARAEPYCWMVVDATLPRPVTFATLWMRVAPIISGLHPAQLQWDIRSGRPNTPLKRRPQQSS